VQAEAFTSGADVFLSAGRTDTASTDGRRLLAHELTHVVQQATGTAGPDGQVSHPGDPSEVEAARVGDAVAAAPRATEASVAREAEADDEELDAASVQVQREAAGPDEEEDEAAA
jgi:hypothetical protein